MVVAFIRALGTQTQEPKGEADLWGAVPMEAPWRPVGMG
jgi:hypothetical protein